MTPGLKPAFRTGASNQIRLNAPRSFPKTAPTSVGGYLISLGDFDELASPKGEGFSPPIETLNSSIFRKQSPDLFIAQLRYVTHQPGVDGEPSAGPLFNGLSQSRYRGLA